jgi:hypothetical protein
MPEEHSNAILEALPTASTVVGAFRTIKMGRKQTRLPVLDTLPTAYFVNGESDGTSPANGLKQTTKMAWDNKYLNAEELAVIVPFPEAVIDDSEYPLTDAALPLAVEAIARAIDAAVAFGTNKPATWGAALATEAISRSHSVEVGTNAAAAGGFAGDVSDAFALVEADGYDVDTILSHTRNRGRARNLRNAQGDRLPEVSAAEWYGVPAQYPARGLWGDTVSAIVGQSDQGLVGIRQDIRVKLLDQAVIQDAEGNIVLNLAQQDAVALRITFRCAWEIANTIRRDNEDADTRFPFAVLTEPAGS